MDRLEIARDCYAAYESGDRSRNTETLTFRGDEACRVEVDFGWDLAA